MMKDREEEGYFHHFQKYQTKICLKISFFVKMTQLQAITK